MELSEKALSLILRFEVGDDWKTRWPEQPEWPGGDSGVTIGIGYDLGYVTTAQFRSDWRDEFVAIDKQRWYARLSSAVGNAGLAAKAIVDQFRDIHVERAMAVRVFDKSTVPRFFELTRKAFPGVDALPADVSGALFSLVYNRGASMGVKGKPSWDSRLEMRNIRDLVASLSKGTPSAEVLLAIAKELRLMERLWRGRGLDGLIRRREAEAELVESSIV